MFFRPGLAAALKQIDSKFRALSDVLIAAASLTLEKGILPGRPRALPIERQARGPGPMKAPGLLIAGVFS
jgi:hypothetical protein